MANGKLGIHDQSGAVEPKLQPGHGAMIITRFDRRTAGRYSGQLVRLLDVLGPDHSGSAPHLAGSWQRQTVIGSKFPPDKFSLQEGALSNELRNEPGSWCIVDLFWTAYLFHRALVHDNDTVSKRERLVLVVGHKERGHFEIADQVVQILSKPDAKLRIKIGEWFIKQEHLWLKARARASATRCCCPPESSRG